MRKAPCLLMAAGMAAAATPASDWPAYGGDTANTRYSLLSYPGFSASRSYYAMFYAAEAVLLDRSVSFSKHSAVIAAFGMHYVKTRLVPSEYHRFLTEAFSLRHSGDYGQRG